MATAAVSWTCPYLDIENGTEDFQNPPLYLHVTSQTKSGLDKAVEKIEELMKQELPNLVDERRFRRKEPDAVERDEFGRVSPFNPLMMSMLTQASANGQRRGFPLILSPFLDLTSVPKL